MTTLRWLTLAACLISAACASARPFTVEDLLRLEAIGPAAIDPTGRWLIQEFEPQYDAAPRFDNDVYGRPTSAKLLRIDLHHPARAEPAFSQDPRGGYVAGPFSPDGRSLIVYRSLHRRWEIGVLTLSSRKVRWLNFGVDFADFGDTVVWRSNTRIVALKLARGDGWWKAPLWEAARRRLPGLWRAAATGRAASAVSVGSGRYGTVHLVAPPRQVVEVNLATGQVRAFAKGLFTRLAVSSSGRTLALIESSERSPMSGATLISPTTPLRRERLQVLDLVHGLLSTPCTDEPLASSLRWSSQSDRLLVFVRPPGAAWVRGRYVAIGPGSACRDVVTQGLTPSIADETDSGAVPTAHGEWLGDAPTLLAKAPGASRADWYRFGPDGAVDLTVHLKPAPQDPILLGGDRAVFLDEGQPWSIRADGQATRLSDQRITRLLPPRRTNNSTAAPDDHPLRASALFALSTSGDQTTLLRISVDEVKPVARSAVSPLAITAGSDAGILADEHDVHGVQRLTLKRPDRSEVLLAEANRRLASVAFAAPHEIDHVGPNGEALKSWLYLPPQGPAKPPLLVMAYPGSNWRIPSVFGEPGELLLVNDNVQLAVAHGYAVLVPSLPKPEGSTDPGLGWAARIFEIVDKVKQTGWVDTDRVGYYGHSYGGYVGLMMATETNRFRAIVAAAPISDLVSFRGEGGPASWLSAYEDTSIQVWAGWSELGAQGHLMATPWTARDRYIVNSPVFQADRMKTPILLVQGDQDPASIDQSREMFSDLFRLGRDALFTTFYGEGHSIVSPPNVRQLDQTVYGFLDALLKPQLDAPTAGPTPRPPKS